ncbi:MAG: hypothetical protein R3D57_19110 [Hyphomicrobiaceae bacterium]
MKRNDQAPRRFYIVLQVLQGFVLGLLLLLAFILFLSATSDISLFRYQQF